MAALKKNVILVPVDFEEGSLKALDLATCIADRDRAELVLLHVYSVPTYAYPGLAPTLMPQLQKEIAERAQEALCRLAGENGNIRWLLTDGDTATEIDKTAREIGAKMIIMGTHGRKGFSRLILGSVADRTLRSSKIPVLIVPPEE